MNRSYLAVSSLLMALINVQTTASAEIARCTLPNGQTLFTNSGCPDDKFLQQKARQEKSLRVLTPRWSGSNSGSRGKVPAYCRSRSGEYYRC
ncbi:MAG: hypothetical protein PVG66_00260 [Chromatiales bacterium]|jgi:hypothetical protein